MYVFLAYMHAYIYVGAHIYISKADTEIFLDDSLSQSSEIRVSKVIREYLSLWFI